MKRLLVVLGVIFGLLIVAVLAVPLFIIVDSFRPKLEKSLSASLNRQVQIGKLSASLLSGGASATDISISDDPAFNKGAFLKASSVNIGLKLMPLIFSHEVDVTGITVKQPDIVLLKNAAGKWNYSSLGSGNSNAKENASDKSTPQISVEKFEIAGGKVRVGMSSRSGPKEQVYQNVNLTAKDISQTSVMPFTLTADTPAGGTLKLSGQAGPLNRQDSSRTPLDAKVTLEHADLAA